MTSATAENMSVLSSASEPQLQTTPPRVDPAPDLLDAPQRPPIANAPLTLLLLAHNDEAHLNEVVAGWIDQLKLRGKRWKIVLVDDGSTDGTRALAESLAERQPLVQVLGHDQA